MKRWIVPLACLLSLVFLGGCSGEPVCDVRSYRYAALPRLLEETRYGFGWIDHNTRYALDREENVTEVYVLSWKESRDMMSDLEVDPECSDLHMLLLNYMDSTIDTFSAYQNEEIDVGEVHERRELLDEAWEKWYLELANLEITNFGEAARCDTTSHLEGVVPHMEEFGSHMILAGEGEIRASMEEVEAALTEMESIRNEVAELEVAGLCEIPHMYLLDFFDFTIAAYQAATEEDGDGFKQNTGLANIAKDGFTRMTIETSD